MERLLSAKEVAEHLGVPLGTIYRWRTTGYGPPAIRVGKHLRYRAADLEQFIERQFAREGAGDVA